MSDELDGVTLVAPLRETAPAPAPAFSVDAAVTRVRAIRRRRVLTAAAAAVIVAAGAVVVPSVRWPWQDRAAYTAAAAHVSARLWPVDQVAADALMPAGNAPAATGGDQLIAGTVTWSPPPDATGMSVSLYLIDKRTGTMPIYWEPTNEAVLIGGSNADNVIARRYPWLSMVGEVHIGNGWTNYTNSLVAPASLRTVTFIALFIHSDEGTVFPGHYALAPVDVGDLMLAVVIHDEDGSRTVAVRAVG